MLCSYGGAGLTFVSSPTAGGKADPLDNSASGSRVNRCSVCRSFERNTKDTVHNGMQLIRVRYGLPYSELPDCSPVDLGRFLSFLLLQGKARPSVAFPRRQRRVLNDDLCILQRLRRDERWSLAHSLASIKRNLPRGCPRHTPSAREQWEARACSQPPPTSPEYLQFVKSICTRLFSSGWDRNYNSFVGSFVPNPSARRPLLSRADLLWSGRRSEFFTLTTHESDLEPELWARYKDIYSAGKPRPMLIFDEKVDLLGPLHKLLYCHLRKQEWILCGPPSEERMTSICVGKIQTSVDLVAATDGLCHSVADVILDSAFFTSLKIPRSLRALAKASLKPKFFGSDGTEKRVTHGQMQGSYLSFPLLCIQSYCAARWAARFDLGARFLVNGDDCVISAKRGITVQDYPSGFRLNSDKTIRAEGVVEINSTAFLKRNGRWREVRHLRRGGAVCNYPGMMHMAEAVLNAGPAWVDAYQRARIGRHWGFLPSQIGHLTYASYLRERQMSRRRLFTTLPVEASPPQHSSLRKIQGRDPTPVEIEVLRSFEWTNGRMVGLKRDVFSPSCGKIRRTYRYRAQPCKYFSSFVGPKLQRKLSALSGKAASFFLVPDDFETEEEREGLRLLDLWRLAFDSLVTERRD